VPALGSYLYERFGWSSTCLGPVRALLDETPPGEDPWLRFWELIDDFRREARIPADKAFASGGPCVVPSADSSVCARQERRPRNARGNRPRTKRGARAGGLREHVQGRATVAARSRVRPARFTRASQREAYRAWSGSAEDRTAALCDSAGTRVHVATATPEELRAAAEDDIVWYEFREGDELPFEFGLFGDAAAMGEPTTLVARRQFWLTLSRDRQIRISYDGKTSTMDEMEFLLTVVPGKDGKARIVWINHLGTGDAEEALREIMGPPKSAAR